MKKRMTPDEQKKVRILFISIDNVNDSIDSLGEINKIYGERIISATDIDHNLREIAIKFGAGFSKRKNKFGDWIFDHTDKVYVINSQGQWVDSLAYNVPAAEFKKAFDEADKLTPISQTSQHKRVDVLASNLKCDLSQGPCTVDIHGEKVSFKITPTPIEVSKPLSMEFKSSNFVASEVDFVGLGENMGYLRPALSSSDPNLYQGQLNLPVCELEEMYWIASVLVKGKNESGVVQFSFKTHQGK
jgi:protein SCO1/2